jgi:hypothetical protein
MYVSYLPNLSHPHMHRYRRTRRQLQYFCEFQRKSERGREKCERPREKERGRKTSKQKDREGETEGGKYTGKDLLHAVLGLHLSAVGGGAEGDGELLLLLRLYETNQIQSIVTSLLDMIEWLDRGG